MMSSMNHRKRVTPNPLHGIFVKAMAGIGFASIVWFAGIRGDGADPGYWSTALLGAACGGALGVLQAMHRSVRD